MIAGHSEGLGMGINSIDDPLGLGGILLCFTAISLVPCPAGGRW